MSHVTQDGVHKLYSLLGLTSSADEKDYDYENGSHGRIHQSPDTHENAHNSDYFKDLDTAQPKPTPSGGGGGGASVIFKVK